MRRTDGAQMASIIDVAKHAGLSVASVSRVLNNSKPVSADIRERVLSSAAILDYSIDQRARGLRRRKSDTIGLIVADAGNPFFALIIHSIEAVAYESKHDLFLCNSDEDPQRERFHLLSMHAQRIDGIIMLPCGASASTLPSFVGTKTPLVCLDRRLPDGDFDLAIVDNSKGVDLAIRHLNGFGHRRIAVVAGHDSTVSNERIDGYRRTLAALGIAERPEYVRRGHNALQSSGYDQTLALLDLPNPPSAIFVTNQLMMLGALGALRDRGVSVPDQMSVVGFDDSPFAELLDPPLTTIAQPTSELGTTAAELLLDRVVRGYAGAARTVVLPPELRVRSSVARVSNVRSASA